jgi:hypothetical protein
MENKGDEARQNNGHFENNEDDAMETEGEESAFYY